jgi:MOSC domain-containing protein YiiM
MPHLTAEALEAGLTEVEAAPTDDGSILLIVRRPTYDRREVVTQGELDPERGLVGDNWPSRATIGADGPERYAQLTLMNARYTRLIASDIDAWPAAGDQVYVDLDLSMTNLPAGTRLGLGSAIIEISAEPHTGCAKFSARFGSEALRLANSERGRALRLRGVNASIVQAGRFSLDDRAAKAD